VSLLRGHDDQIRPLQTNHDGEVVLTDLPLGDSVISITMRGFRTSHREVTIRDGDEQKVEVALQIGSSVGPMVVVSKRHWWHIFR
jgi:hypothetical protein